MKTNFIVCLLLVVSLISCKDKTNINQEDQKETIAIKKNTLKLSNYSDENWKNGVGISFNFFLVDFTPENEELLKKGKELEFNNGTILPYLGYEVVGKFIRVNLNEKASEFQDIASYPNDITIN